MRSRTFRIPTRYARFVLVAALVGFGVVPFFGQAFQGSVVGTVADGSGAAIPDAAVTLTNIGTSDHYTATTNSQGNYEFVSVIPGQYSISIEKTGFKHFNRESFRVHVESALRVDATMQVGDVSQTIEVSGQAPLLETQTSTLSQVVEGRQVEDTPLNGRNPLNLLNLIPGVIGLGASTGAAGGNQLGGQFTNNFGWGNLQIGGGLAGQNSVYLDGSPLNAAFANSIGIIPTQDSVQEFRALTNNVSPEFGGFTGGVVSMSTKSGTNDFHGTLYEYLRNKLLNANFFFNNRTNTPRPSFEQNQYGAALGGPVVRNKAFFFFSWEGFDVLTGTPILTTVPTLAERPDVNTTHYADFSGLPTIYDPYTNPRTPFPGNIIPANRIDPAALALLKLYALPNTSQPGGNFAANADTGTNQNEYAARVDYTLSERQRIFGRYSYWNGKTQSYNPFQNASGLSATIYNTDAIVLGDTLSMTPKTVGDFRLSYLRSNYSLLPPSTGKADLAQYGAAWSTLASQLTYQENPEPIVAGFYSFSNMDTHNLGITNNYALSGSITKISGRHMIKFGGEVRRLEFYFGQLTNSSGNFNFDNGFTSESGTTSDPTGYSLASYMLGTPSSATLGTLTRTSAVMYYDGFYVNDTFQMSRKLTLNLGLRWEIPGAFTDKHDRATELLPFAVDPLSQSTGLPLKGQLVLVNSPQYPSRDITKNHFLLFEPRVGMAYQVQPGTVIRLGYGLSHEYLPGLGGVGTGTPLPGGSPINTASTSMVTSLNGGLTPANVLSNPFPNGVIEPAGRNAAALAALEGTSITGPVADTPLPYVQQWNLDIQQELPGAMLFDLAYAGSKGTHLPRGGLSNTALDQLPDQYDSTGPALLAQVSNPFAGRVAPSSVLNASTVAAGQLLRPYPQFTGVFAGPPDIGDSTYSALQSKLVERFHGGGTLLTSFTWAKMLSDSDTASGFLETNGVGAVQDAYNPRGERSLTSFDVAYSLVVSYVLDLPFGNGQKWLGHLHGPANGLISGWQVNGITTFQGGFPLPLTAQASVLETTFGAGTTRPNVVAGCDKFTQGSAVSRLNDWFNTACFSQPGAYSFGNESRTDPNLRTDGIKNFDFATQKTTAITERVSLEFNAEFFNIFNRVQFQPPGEQYNAGTINTPQNLFGVITGQQNQPRLAQFALRIRF